MASHKLTQRQCTNRHNLHHTHTLTHTHTHTPQQANFEVIYRKRWRAEFSYRVPYFACVCVCAFYISHAQLCNPPPPHTHTHTQSSCGLRLYCIAMGNQIIMLPDICVMYSLVYTLRLFQMYFKKFHHSPEKQT